MHTRAQRSVLESSPLWRGKWDCICSYTPRLAGDDKPHISFQLFVDNAGNTLVENGNYGLPLLLYFWSRSWLLGRAFASHQIPTHHPRQFMVLVSRLPPFICLVSLSADGKGHLCERLPCR